MPSWLIWGAGICLLLILAVIAYGLYSLARGVDVMATIQREREEEGWRD